MRKLILVLAMMSLLVGFTAGYAQADDGGDQPMGYNYHLMVYTYYGSYVAVDGAQVNVKHKWSTGSWINDGNFNIDCPNILTVDIYRYHATSPNITWRVELVGSNGGNRCDNNDFVAAGFSYTTRTAWYGQGTRIDIVYE